jgi:hypothetical protein
MPLYELVLRYEDRDEIRLTDRPVSVGQSVEIAGESWTVTLERDPEDGGATAQFLCELTLSQRQRAKRLQTLNAEMEGRLVHLRQRMDGHSDQPAPDDPELA